MDLIDSPISSWQYSQSLNDYSGASLKNKETVDWGKIVAKPIHFRVLQVIDLYKLNSGKVLTNHRRIKSRKQGKLGV